jgi:hypothetical protein
VGIGYGNSSGFHLMVSGENLASSGSGRAGFGSGDGSAVGTGS